MVRWSWFSVDHKFDIVTWLWSWFLTKFDILTVISSWFLRDFPVIYEVKAYRDVTVTWFSTIFLRITVISSWSLHVVTKNPVLATSFYPRNLDQDSMIFDNSLSLRFTFVACYYLRSRLLQCDYLCLGSRGNWMSNKWTVAFFVYPGTILWIKD